MGEIMPRDTTIVVSFGNIRAIVGLRCVWLADAQDPSVQLFSRELSSLFRPKEHRPRPVAEDRVADQDSRSVDADAKELVFLEQLLRDTVDSYHRRLRIYEPIVGSFLDRIDSEVYSDTGVHLLVPLKDSLNGFELQVKQSYECLTGLMQQDDLMLALLLTEQEEARRTGRSVEFSRHEHVELLLGVYARQLSNIRLETQYLLGRLQSKQEFVALALAGYRNRLIRVNVHLAIVTVALGVGTATAGFFGMNLVNGFEHAPHAFGTVVSLSGLSGILLAAGSLNYLSGRSMKRRATQRLDEIETLTSALSDLCAVDYAIKSVTDEGKSFTRDQFRLLLSRARKSHISDKEVDILFNVLDKVPDGSLSANDFQSWPGSRGHAGSPCGGSRETNSS
jgi:magnesium transporter